jgi:hypothetical protein
MALSEEQRTMLQLLLAGGQGYDDISGLLGVPVDEVRSRARAALEELAGSDPDATVGLTDYLLGQADPIGRADAVRVLQRDPALHALATDLVAKLRLLAPGAVLPEVPSPRGRVGGGGPAEPGPPSPGREPAPGVAHRGPVARIGTRRLAVGLTALALLVAAVVAAVVVTSGDGGSGSEPEPGLAVIPMRAVGGSGAGGQVAIAVDGQIPVMQLNFNGLEPSGQNRSYVLWLYNDGGDSFPLGRQDVGSDGSLNIAVELPQQALAAFELFRSIDLSLASNDAIVRATQNANQSQTLIREHVGKSVLRGRIPADLQQQVLGQDAVPQTTTGATGATTTQP